MLDAVLLDWEGVLADTRDARREALRRAFGDEGIPVDDAVLAAAEDMTRANAVAHVLRLAGRRDPTLADLVALRASRAFAERLGKGFVLAPGARAFVEHLRVRALVAVVTSATRAETEFVLGLAGLDGSIATIVSADDTADWDTGSTHLAAVARLGRGRSLDPRRVAVLAQRPAVLGAARCAGLRTVAVGAAAHLALTADGAVDGIDGLTVSDVARIAGVTAVEHHT